VGVKRGLGLRFQKKASRPPLTREQFLYWRDLLSKILKLGTEFEVNLPSAERGLKSQTAEPCIHSKKKCVTDCANLEMCLSERHPTFCLTRETGNFVGKEFSCPAKDNGDVAACANCPGWALNCRGLDCALHIPFCTICPSFLRKSDAAIENTDIRQDADAVRAEMKDLFKPSGDVSRVGEAGVLEIKKDGSLVNNGGIEIPTVGRRVHWNSFYRMSREIIGPIVDRGGYINERCGQHYHLLAGYFGDRPGPGGSRNPTVSELEIPMPEIILANYHQLHRRYEAALFWIMSAGESMETLTRWAKFRQPVRQYSAMQSTMRKIQKELADNIPGGGGATAGKYASCSYYFCKFNSQGQVSTLHIENRIADGCLSPSVITAWGMMVYAMMLKAVRLSQYGIMEIGSREYSAVLEEASPHLVNGQNRDYGSHRSGDTSGIGPYIPFFRDNARELIQLLKGELNKMGPSFDILMQLADRPVSLRRTQGDSWEEIENELNPQSREGDSDNRYLIESEVAEVVDLTGIVECENLDVWIEEVAAHIDQPPAIIAEIVAELLSSGRYRWSDVVGALITTA
jgi:hypothetical protein